MRAGTDSNPATRQESALPFDHTWGGSGPEKAAGPS
jgi:hypothetical protein